MPHFPMPFTMPNGQKLESRGRFVGPEVLYNAVVNNYLTQKTMKSVSLLSRWAQVSNETVNKILEAHAARN